MEQVTPPQRSSQLLETQPSSPSEYKEPLLTPNPTLSTPAANLEVPSRKHFWTSDDNLRYTAQQQPNLHPSDGKLPSTPLTSLESNDGSIIKTPFGNLGLWNATSPGIVDTPTPAGVHPARQIGRDVLPFVGATSELITPQFSSNPALFGLHAKGVESPLAAKKRQLETQLCKRLPTNTVEASPGSVSFEDTPLRPLNLPILTLAEASQESMDEDCASLGSPMDKVSVHQPDVETLMSEPVTVDTSGSSEVESVRSAQSFHPRNSPSIPPSILHWLDVNPSRGSEACATLRSSRRKEGHESTRKRLAQFVQTRRKSLPRLEVYVHEQLGRVLQPHEDDTESYGILGLHELPDDLYPWSLTRLSVDTKQVKARLRELEMIERYLEGGTSSSEDDSPPPKADPADAMVALRSKKRSRRWMQQRKEASRAVKKIFPATTTQRISKRAGKGPSVTVPKVPIVVDSQMDVDKDSDEVACICKGPDDGRPMIQCDNCHSWLHVDCVTREEERSQLPDKWYCWKCPIGTAPDRVSMDVQPIFVAGTPEYPKNKHNTAADVAVYQPSEKQQASPELGSYAPGHKVNSSSLLESGLNGSSLVERTPPSSGKDWSRHSYNIWSESEIARHENDRLDDPMTAIASTPFIGSTFASPYGPYEESSFDHLHSTPNRNFGLRFVPPPSTTPRKERPWTNYIGSFATPTNPAGPQLSPLSAQALPIVQTDPLFIHYEHDAPKQTAHHHGRSKKKSKPKEKETHESDKGDEGSVQAPPDSAESSNTDEIGPFSDSGTADASTPVGSQE